MSPEPPKESSLTPLGAAGPAPWASWPGCLSSSESSMVSGMACVRAAEPRPRRWLFPLPQIPGESQSQRSSVRFLPPQEAGSPRLWRSLLGCARWSRLYPHVSPLCHLPPTSTPVHHSPLLPRAPLLVVPPAQLGPIWGPELPRGEDGPRQGTAWVGPGVRNGAGGSSGPPRPHPHHCHTKQP